MGFEPPVTGLKLDFSEHPLYAGLEVTMSGISMGGALELEETPAAALGARKVVARFADHLESWNVTKLGEPVPADLDGVLSQDPAFVEAIILAWLRNLSSAPPPLSEGSGSGETSGEVPTGLADASRSLPS